MSDTGGNDGEDGKPNRGPELRDGVEYDPCETLGFGGERISDDEVCDGKDD